MTDTDTTTEDLRAALDHAREQVRALTARDEAQSIAHDRWHSTAERRQLRRQIQYWQGEVQRLRREIGEG